MIKNVIKNGRFCTWGKPYICRISYLIDYIILEYLTRQKDKWVYEKMP